MTEPKTYKMNEKITEKDLVRRGFVKTSGKCYKIRKNLYGNYITLRLIVDTEEKFIIANVVDADGLPYPPFYDPNVRHNNNVYEQVVNNYNTYMDALVEKKILEYHDAISVDTESLTIMIKYHADIEKIEKITVGDWIDLRVAEDVFIPYNTYKLVSLGVSMKLPEGYEAHVVPRSSTFKNFGIIQTNHIGIIDNSYSGTNDIWRFPAYCIEPKNTVNGRQGTLLHKNDRICQFRIMKQQDPVVFEEVDVLDETDRGGFGSTGKN